MDYSELLALYGGMALATAVWLWAHTKPRAPGEFLGWIACSAFWPVLGVYAAFSKDCR